MAVNKNALVRYQVLDRCFRNTGRMYFVEDLLEECNSALENLDSNSAGIQRRQLYKDISFMESSEGWSVELAKNKYGKKVYYRYKDPAFSINNEPLNASEIAQLKAALQMLGRFSGTPQFEWISEIISRLESRFGLIGKDSQIIGFESNIDLKGLDFLTPLFNAIVNERVLRITYQDFKSPDPYEVTLHPYYLKQFNNRWFVLGLNATNQIPTWNLALDRIHSIHESHLTYKPTHIDWEDYFFDLVGVTKPDDGVVQEVILQFDPALAPYILTKPLHPSQKQKNNPTGMEVKIKVIPNYELERLILSFGEQVRVLAPDSLVDRITQRVELTRQQYESIPPKPTQP